MGARDMVIDHVSLLVYVTGFKEAKVHEPYMLRHEQPALMPKQACE